MVSREARAGLASGFIAFVAGEKGQRVVLKAGLVPATMPVRIVEVNNKPLF
jgi:phosphate transport system substrate-binding protein